VFTDEDFQHEWEVQDTSSKLQNCCQPVSQQGSPPIQCAPHLAPEPCISTQLDSATLTSTSSRIDKSTSFQNISPLFTPSYSLSSAKGKKRQHTDIWTSTHKKVYLEAKKEKKTNFEARKQKKTGKELDSQTRKKACAASAIKSSTPKKPVLRNLNKIFNDSSYEDDIADERNTCDDSDGDGTECEEEKCFFCDELIMENEMWFRCTVCDLWVHSLCSGWDSPKG
jgi:hypothetical protein